MALFRTQPKPSQPQNGSPVGPLAGYPAIVQRIKSVVRFNVAFNDPVAVVSCGDADLLDLEGRRTFDFPTEPASAMPMPDVATDAAAIAQLEQVRLNGARFLLVPATGGWLLDTHPNFRRHLESNYRLVARSPECTLFSLRWPEDGKFRNAGAPDGLPLPPPELIRLTVSNEDSERFYLNGEKGAAWVRELVGRHGTDLEDVGSLLDFGCGCGRVVRQWRLLENVQVLGADYNPYLVAWCRRNLPFARFRVVKPTMGVDFPDESVGVLYAMSVFTHLDAARQEACMAEFTRILRPGGLLLLTVSGSTRADRLNPDERARYDGGEMVIRHANVAGSNKCSVFHPEAYIRDNWTSDLELIDLVPGGATDINQDAVLLRKP